MEGVLSHRVTPLLKCVVLFLFIFTAKVLTSRPQETQDTRNSIHQLKPSHYVRTFTKYHHRRTIQWNNILDANYWPITQDHPKVIGKRSVPSSKSFFSGSDDVLNNFAPESNRENSVSSSEKKVSNKNRNEEKNSIRKFQVMEAKIFTDAPTTVGSHISCLYKIHNVAVSVTPYDDEETNSQPVVETDMIDSPGPLSDITLNGETVKVEQCIDPRDSCYTLYKEEADNVTILGQGCWHLSLKPGVCNNCMRVDRIPQSKFCCCSSNLCNANYKSLQERIIPPKAESTVDTESQKTNYSNIIVFGVLALIIILVVVIMMQKVYCKKTAIDKDDMSGIVDVEKGDVASSKSDLLATGLLCVDNLTLIEHIGQGKFGSVWRGTLASTPVAVKLYTNANAWQREAAIYSTPHISHPNLLRYYGSDSRPSLSDGVRGTREYLIVLELCSETLRSRLEAAPLTWLEFATLAHGLASALAHLHTASVGKGCVVHRDVTSNNVLVCRGQARLADLGLAQCVASRRDRAAPTTLTEAGTLRYLAPEALEGALDLSGARAALCAVDVFALGLVLWEMLWRCSGAHAGRTPPYAPPYQHHGLPPRPTLAQMQSLVSRNKARPPLPKGPVSEGRALKIATDTCDECWDHDAEARLTAVCVEERMTELKMMLHTQGPVIHDNNLHPHPANNDTSTPPETDKNSNCTATQNSDVTTPLLYSHPHIGRNACIERNTLTNTQTHAELIHKSLKDISVPTDTTRHQNIDENCLSVARLTHNRIVLQDYENSDRLNEIRSYQRPLEYVQNDVSSQDMDRGPKQTNLLHDTKNDKSKWGIKKFFERKLNRNPKVLETEVKLISETLGNGSGIQNGRTKTSIVNEKPINMERPTNLVIDQNGGTYNFEAPCTLSPPNRTLSPTMMIESEMNRSENKVFKKLPSDESDSSKAPSQIFAVIVPKAKPTDFGNIIEMRSKASNSRGSSESINKQSVRTSMSSQSIFKSGQSESEDSTVKKRLSCDNRIITNASNSDRSSKASTNIELRYLEDSQDQNLNSNNSAFDLNSDCSSSEDENLMLLSEGSKITMQTIPKTIEIEKKKYQNDVLKETSQMKTDFGFNKHQYKYTNFDNEFSDPNDKENLVNGYSGDNPVYLAALNGEIDTSDLKTTDIVIEKPKSPKPNLKNLTIKRQRSLEQVSEIFTSSGDVHLQNPAGRVKTPGDLPVAVRRARRDRALQKGRASECNRLSLYDDRMMFGNSL